MKKGLTALVILGAIAGSVAYKLKKDQKEKELLDKELDMLSSDEVDEEVKEFDYSDKCEHDSCKCEESCNCEEACECEEKEVNINPFTEGIDEDYKKQLDSNCDDMIEKLDEENDLFEEERPIQHMIDFKTLEDMEAFKAVVIEKGYVVTRGENPYQLSVLHIAPINRSELLVNVYYLANQAMKHNGVYQGWHSRKVL